MQIFVPLAFAANPSPKFLSSKFGGKLGGLRLASTRNRGRVCVTTAQRGSRNVAADLKQLCCTRDEGWPLEIGLQDQVSNHRKLLGSNGSGGERFGKRRDEPVRYALGRRTKVNCR